ncbi:MAG TPA: peptidylprolyl isomerase [Polyangia bacterium]|jgi:FKBP-type peptidyl-prolyl cis-trans isomerase SlyD|nr:peptidylprolyl isomerase [Polyangia bacterium]
MQITDQKAVTIHYTLKDDAGEVLDTSRGRDPLNYLQGAGNVVPGLEKALAGKEAGATIAVTLAPEEAYGPRDDGNVRNVPLRKLSADGKVTAGTRCRVQTADGAQLAQVVAVRGDYATVDLNHPLAGMQLHFDVEVVAVRDATPEELGHGHVHGPGGHHG